MSRLPKNICLSFHLADGTLCSIQTFGNDHLSQVVGNEEKANPFPWSVKNFEGSISSSHICVGVFLPDKILAAHAVFSLAAGEAELLNLAVAPEYQGKGIAKLLLQNMCSLLSEHAQEIFLEVRAGNESAIGLYETLGFNCLGERRNYYPGSLVGKRQKEDALIFGMTLIE